MADLLIRLVTKYTGRGVDQAKKDVKALKSLALDVGGALGLTFGVQELASFTADSVNLAREQAAAEAQVAAAIQSTSNAAGTSLDELKAHAAALQSITNFGDEATLQGQGLLLTFTNIQDNLPRATTAMLDVATAMGTDVKSAAIQVGKALNDPIMGLSALSRSGIQFSDEQKRLIKSLVETNRVADAQTIILDELERQFGGSAVAAREADGGFKAIANSFGDLQEKIGALVMELANTNEGSNIAVAGIDTLGGRVDAWTGIVKNAQTAWGKFTERFEIDGQSLIESAEDVARGLAKGMGPLGEFVVGGAIDFVKDMADRKEELDQAQADAAAAAQDGGDQQSQIEESTAQDLTEIKRELADRILDIQEESNQAQARAAQDLADDLEDLNVDHGKRLLEIEQRTAKQRAKINAQLAKDLARNETSTKKSIAKQIADENKRIQRLEEKASKEEKRQRRIAKIDALGDERLFQFELRQLAADGEAIAIRDAIERRAIEQEIAEEKAQVEKQIESDRRDDQVRSIREEGAERRNQLQLDAQERANAIQERHTEEQAELNAHLAEQMQSERENFAERKADLESHNAETIARIREGEAEKIAEVGEGLTGVEELTRESFADLVSFAEQIGPDIGKALADGIEKGVKRGLDIDKLLGESAGDSGIDTGFSALPQIDTSNIRNPLAFANEGVVPGGSGQGVPTILHGGEVVLNPANSGELGGGTVVIGDESFIASNARRMGDAFNELLMRTLQAYTDEVLVGVLEGSS